MEIIHLKKLKEFNFDLHPVTHEKEYNVGMSITEIEEAEIEFNSGNPFPTELRELLYLAGKTCNLFSNQKSLSMLAVHRKYSLEYGSAIANFTSRPYILIEDDTLGDIHVGGVYLDQGDHPITFTFYMEWTKTPAGLVYNVDMVVEHTTIKESTEAGVENLKKRHEDWLAGRKSLF